MHVFSLLIGVVVNIFLAWLAFKLAGNLTAALFPVEEYSQGFLPILHWFAAVISVYYFGIKGLVHVDTAHKNVVEFFERRLHLTLGEGWNWILPSPIMSSIPTDVRQRPLDPHFDDVLTKDEIPVGVDAFALVRIGDPCIFHSVDEPFAAFDKFFERTVRILISREWSMDTEVEGEDDPVPGVSKADEKLSEKLDEELKTRMEQWGLVLDEAMIKGVQLPKKITDATAQKRAELQQRKSEMTQIEGVREQMDVFKGLRLSPKERLDAVQAERSKIRKIVVDGSATPLEKAGALAGGGILQE